MAFCKKMQLGAGAVALGLASCAQSPVHTGKFGDDCNGSVCSAPQVPGETARIASVIGTDPVAREEIHRTTGISQYPDTVQGTVAYIIACKDGMYVDRPHEVAGGTLTSLDPDSIVLLGDGIRHHVSSQRLAVHSLLVSVKEGSDSQAVILPLIEHGPIEFIGPDGETVEMASEGAWKTIDTITSPIVQACHEAFSELSVKPDNSFPDGISVSRYLQAPNVRAWAF